MFAFCREANVEDGLRIYRAGGGATGLYRRDEFSGDGERRHLATVVADGFHLWREEDGIVTVIQDRNRSKRFFTDWTEPAVRNRALVKGVDRCDKPVRRGVEIVAGRLADVVELSPANCTRDGSDGAGLLETVWLDRETLFTLKRVRRDAVTGQVVEQFAVTELAVNPELSSWVFTYVPPAHAVVHDYRTEPVPSPDTINSILGSFAANAGFAHYFLPDLTDYGYVPMWPVHHGSTTTLVYTARAGQQTAGDSVWAGVILVQYPVSEPGANRGGDGAPALPAGLAMYGQDEHVVVERDGTVVVLMSENLSRRELQALVARLVRADAPAVTIVTGQGSYSLVPSQRQPALAALADEVGFTLFEPVFVPSGLVPRPPGRPTGSQRHVHLVYMTAGNRVGMRVTMGPAGSGLDSVPGRDGRLVNIRSDVDGHVLDLSPADGGPILWWVEDGTYVVISGPELTEQDLIEVAQHLVPVAPGTTGD